MYRRWFMPSDNICDLVGVHSYPLTRYTMSEELNFMLEQFDFVGFSSN